MADTHTPCSRKRSRQQEAAPAAPPPPPPPPLQVNIYTLAGPSSLQLSAEHAATVQIAAAHVEAGDASCNSVHGVLRCSELEAAAAGLGVPASCCRFFLRNSDFMDLTKRFEARGQSVRLISNLAYSPNAQGVREARPWTVVLVDTRHPLPVLPVLLSGLWGALGPRDVTLDYTWTFADLVTHVRQWLPEEHRTLHLRLLVEERRAYPRALLGCDDLPPPGQVCVLAADPEPDRRIYVSVAACGKTHTLHVSGASTIQDIWQQLWELDGIEPQSYRLVFEGERLRHDCTVEECRIDPEDTLDLLPAQVGGKPVICIWPAEPTQVSVRLALSPAWAFSSLVPRPDCTDVEDGVAATGVGGRFAQWQVTAQPDGTLTHEGSGGRTYSYLFWEGGALPSPPLPRLQQAGSSGNGSSNRSSGSGVAWEAAAPSSPVAEPDAAAHATAAAAAPSAGPQHSQLPLPSLPVPYFDPAHSFCVAGEHVEAWLYGALEAFGLPTRERTDMLTYWPPHMEGAAWLLIAFVDPAHYQAAAALHVHPAPDALVRLFMLFERLAAPVEAHGSLATEVARVGVLRREGARLAVLEWGGMEVVRGGRGRRHA